MRSCLVVCVVRAEVAATGDERGVSLVPLHTGLLLHRCVGIRQLQVRERHSHLHRGRDAYADAMALRSRLLPHGRSAHARLQSPEVAALENILT